MGFFLTDSCAAEPTSGSRLYPQKRLPPITGATVGRRSYSPGMGRWMSRDPIEEQGGINLYRFLAGHPAYAVDPIGLGTVDDLTRQLACRCIVWGLKKGVESCLKEICEPPAPKIPPKPAAKEEKGKIVWGYWHKGRGEAYYDPDTCECQLKLYRKGQQEIIDWKLQWDIGNTKYWWDRAVVRYEPVEDEKPRENTLDFNLRPKGQRTQTNCTAEGVKWKANMPD